MTVFTYEKGRRGGACRDFLESSGRLANFKMLTILPIPTTRDGVYINGSDKTLHSLAREAGEGEVFLGYGIPEWLVDVLSGAGAIVVDAERDGEFLNENARLTALAVVCYLLSDGSVTPDERRIGIVGYGRIGGALLRLLIPLGCAVTVYSTRESVVHCLNSSGIVSELVRDGSPLPECELLLNTAPAPIFDTRASLPRGMKIIELAQGDNFGDLEVLRLPSLPNRYFPVSAGRAYAASLLRGLGGTI